MAARAFRVYDSDFTDITTNDLINEAASIALSYAGNWDSMIAWQRHCQAAQRLDVSQARTILNMALSDATQSHWHPRIRERIRRFTPRIAEPRERRPQQPHLTVVDSGRKWMIDLHAHFNSRLFRPNHPQGKLHLVEHHRTFMRWSVREGRKWGDREPNVDDPKRPRLMVFGQCGKMYDNPVLPDNPEHRYPEEFDPELLMLMCSKCMALAKQRAG